MRLKRGIFVTGLTRVLVVGLLISIELEWAQGQSGTHLAFEVASIRPANVEHQHYTLHIGSGDTVGLEGATVKTLIEQAYDVRDFQISGGPGWIDSDKYDIAAKAESSAGVVTLDNLRPMLQDMLADRFNLRLHHDTKELSNYRLIQSKGGSKLKLNTTAGGPQGRGSPGHLMLQKVGTSILATQLARQIGRPVVDATGLKGEYDIVLEWTPDESQTSIPMGERQPEPPTNTIGPSLFTALEEQLGLKLESEKGPVDVIVIDSVERPSEN